MPARHVCRVVGAQQLGI